MSMGTDRVGHMGFASDDLRGLLGQVVHHLARDSPSDELVQSSSVHCCMSVHVDGFVVDESRDKVEAAGCLNSVVEDAIWQPNFEFEEPVSKLDKALCSQGQFGQSRQ